MKSIIWPKKVGYTIVLGALTTALGCESISILGRENVEPRYGDRRDTDRRDTDRRGDIDRRGGEDRDYRRNQVSGTVQDVDERRGEIHLRTDDGRTTAVRYDDNTRITDGSRDIRVGSLRSGDSVSIRLERGSGGEQYADAIQVEDRRGSGSRR